MKRIFLLIFCLLLVACSSKPIPEWQLVGYKQLESYKQAYLEGESNIAELHFRKAVAEIKKSGDLEKLARIYLTRCAVQVAMLETMDDREYLEIVTVQVQPGNQAFYEMLKGHSANLDKRSIPPQYRAFITKWRKNDLAAMNEELLRIQDPLSVLIATGLLVKGARYDAETLSRAVDVASLNGWKKALLTYLETQRAFYEKTGNGAQNELIKRKIKLLRN